MHRTRLYGGIAVVAAALIATSGSAQAQGAGAPPHMSFTANARADAGEGAASGQNEPQVTVDQNGLSYVTWQGSPSTTGLSTTRDGVGFTYRGSPDPGHTALGDVAMATTSWTHPTRTVPTGAPGTLGTFWTDLGLTSCGGPINMRSATTLDQAAHFTQADATCQPAQVDRNWTAAYTEPAYRGTPQAVAHTWVYNEYHDFGISNVWVSVSSNGGASYDPVQHDAIQPGSAAATSFCNTIPGGIAVDQRGRHPGRVYTVWQSSDVTSNPEGCNYTQAEPFDHIWLSYSDDHGLTWTSHEVWNDPCAPNPPLPPTQPQTCQDTSEIFTPVAVDDAGNVYVAFTHRDLAAPDGRGPQYDISVAWSTDGGNSFSRGTVDHPGAPRMIDHDRGTHYFPWIAAGSDGHVDVVYYATSYVEGVGFNNKPAAAPGSAVWNVFLAQSLDLPHGAPVTTSQVTTHPNYFGDICSTGIFCGLAPPGSNWGNDRTLFDDFGVAIGPDGGARIAWTDTRDSWSSTCHPGGNDDSNVKCQTTHVYFACQRSGVGLHGEVVTGCGQSHPRDPISRPRAERPGSDSGVGLVPIALLGPLAARAGRRRLPARDAL